MSMIKLHCGRCSSELQYTMEVNTIHITPCDKCWKESYVRGQSEALSKTINEFKVFMEQKSKENSK